jgi:putative polyhydroxyalkanoate system protein
MADIDIRRAHGMGLAQARAAADQMAEKLGRKFGLKGEWDGDELHFQGTGVTGKLIVDAKDVVLSVVLGFLLKAMKPSIEKAVQHELDSLFAARAAPAAATKKKAAPPPKKGR